MLTGMFYANARRPGAATSLVAQANIPYRSYSQNNSNSSSSSNNSNAAGNFAVGRRDDDSSHNESDKYVSVLFILADPL
jgi:hypothetical protein